MGGDRKQRGQSHWEFVQVIVECFLFLVFDYLSVSVLFGGFKAAMLSFSYLCLRSQTSF